MAWYALWKWFSKFRLTPYLNYIEEYKKQMYTDWFITLIKEEQEEEFKRQDKMIDDHISDAEAAMKNLGLIYDSVDEMTKEKIDKYRKVYGKLVKLNKEIKDGKKSKPSVQPAN